MSTQSSCSPSLQVSLCLELAACTGTDFAPSESAFEESFPLRSNTNRFLGISNPSPFVLSATQSLTLLTSTASLLSVEITAPQGLIADLPGTEGFKTRKLKSKIEQAVFYGGDAADNPLAFDLLPDFEGDLTAAAEAVSSEILSSSASFPCPPERSC